MRAKIYHICFMLITGGFSVMSQAAFTPLTNFGDNPGELTATYYAAGTDVNHTVLLLHGCTQNGEKFAKDSGFLSLAQQHKFNLLIAQQSYGNNIQGCFNWFSKQDTDKDSGELLSLKNMMLAVTDHVDDHHFYVAGLSAGGAMASALLYHYPELINAVAIVAGIPYPCADSLTKAIACMRQGPSQDAKELAQQVKAKHTNDVDKWPRLSVWTGRGDRMVNPKNSNIMVQQWLHLTEHSLQPQVENKQGYTRSTWANEDHIWLELVEVDGLNHGFMVSAEQIPEQVPPYVLESVISASEHIVKFWQLAP